MTFAKRFFATLFVLSALSVSTWAQGTISGQEALVQGSGATLSVTPPNTSALNFSAGTGVNTFLIPLTNPSVSVRFYVTNNTANACPSGFTAQVWAATDAQTSSFNQSLQNWQVIPIQDTSGNLLQAILPNIPANGAVYFSTTAVSAPRMALQFINTTAGCATTNIEISAVITPVAVTSPLVSANSPTNFNGTTSGQVQGVISQFQNGNPVNPIILAGVELPLNGALLTAGIDNWNSNFKSLSTGNSGLFIINTSPAPAAKNELAISIDADTSDNVSSSIIAPWTCVAGNSCTNASGLSVAFTKNPSASTAYGRVYQNVTSNGQELNSIVLFSGVNATVRQSIITASATTGVATTLAGSTLVVAVECSLTSCTVPNPTDSQGNNYVLLTVQNFTNGNRASSLWVWASTTLATASTDTVTWAASAGTINLTAVIEISGNSVASVTTPAVSQQVDPSGRQVIALDAQAGEQFVSTITISTNTTTQIQIAPTVIGNNIPARLYVTDFQINTTTAGTATTIQLKTGTGANCGTGTLNLSAIQYANTAVGLTTVSGFRTPLITPIQNAVCVTQAGTTAGTSVVEIHGYIAP